MNHSIQRTVLGMLLLVLTGCYYLQPQTNPIGLYYYINGDDTVHESLHTVSNNQRLLILLPGIGDTANAFDKKGFVDAIQNSHNDMDVIAVNAHFKYYQSRALLSRLHTDVVLPALANGYTNIHIGGISLGGFGALLYFKQHPEYIASVTMLAPYLGEEEDYHYLLTNSPPPETIEDRNLWPWIMALSDTQKAKMYIGYGDEDKFSVPNGILADLLKPEQVVVQDGKHRWHTWQQLWPELIGKVY